MRSRTHPGDDYEAKQMSAGGVVLHRDKQVARAAFWMMAPMAALLLLVTVAVAAGADPAAPRAAALLPLAGLLGTLWMMFTKLAIRTVLTTEQLEVHWGLRRWKVPVSAITHCEVVAALVGGLPAARLAVNAWAPRGQVLVHWTDERGEAQKLQFPADDPGALVARVQGARVSTPAPAARVSQAPREVAPACDEEAPEGEAGERANDA